MTSPAPDREGEVPSYDVVVVGAGFAGLYMLHRLRQAGFTVRVFDKAGDVGGTWYWNRYPGARCDVESLFYSYSFDNSLQQEWEWTERYPTQPEILRYLQHVADRFDLRDAISLGTTVQGMTFDDGAGIWAVHTDVHGTVRSRFVIAATGCLSVPMMPSLPGMETFRGRSVHTGDWPHDGVDVSGLRVAVIGTGSSGVQVIPQLAADAAELTVFQRTPNFGMPARNRPLQPGEQQQVKRAYPRLREEARRTSAGTIVPRSGLNAVGTDPARVRQELEAAWALGGSGILARFEDILVSHEANDMVAAFLRERIREIVEDPTTAAALCPAGFPVGAKRVTVGTNYFESFNQPNVRLVDTRADPIQRITPYGVRTQEEEHESDVIVYATGFDAMTGALLRMDIRGSGGTSLSQRWEAGPHTYLGLGIAGFPNLFIIAGPGSPSVLGNVLVSIEQHVEWIGDYLEHLRESGITRTEAEPSAQEAWVVHVNEVAGETLFLEAASWYMGANVPGKPRVFMPYAGGFWKYRQLCDRVAHDGYPGFAHTRVGDSEPALVRWQTS
ncbi:flavin-containing monooxygenase [Arthrobacter sp. GCM10027362]|uniref:flavin-containing monooxygenase n=1 Tax=Arthrobacter sp. GCM10027362 TaxID=3273379 RepID=UPI00363866E4